MALQDDKVMQGLELKSLLMCGDHFEGKIIFLIQKF
jgi:hypothetical protein